MSSADFGYNSPVFYPKIHSYSSTGRYDIPYEAKVKSWWLGPKLCSNFLDFRKQPAHLTFWAFPKALNRGKRCSLPSHNTSFRAVGPDTEINPTSSSWTSRHPLVHKPIQAIQYQTTLCQTGSRPKTSTCAADRMVSIRHNNFYYCGWCLEDSRPS